MNVRIVAAALLTSTAILGYTNPSFAETCYVAEGSVTTENITSSIQIGSISLTLSDQDGGIVYSETGNLVGSITGTDGFGTIYLSHKAKFPQGNAFVTSGDVATLVPPYVRKTLDDGTTACSFWIKETISNIANGTRFFSHVTSANVVADGYISSCPDDNENAFALSGELCVE